MPASPSTPRLYRIVFVFWESSAFERYSLWNYWVCWDSSRFGILSDRKPLFYIRNSLLFARNHWKPSVKPIISTRCWLLFHRNHICRYVIMYENAGTGYHPVTPFWWKLLVLFFFFFRGWQGQPVGQSTRPSTQPTGLARQLRQSARSTAHCDKIRETKKQKTKQKPTHGQKLGSCIISILIETISFSVYCFFSFRGLTWPASWPVRLAIHSANSGPTGLASQLRQSARSTAHFREIRKIRKPKNQHMYRNLEAVAYPFWVTGW